MTDSVANTSADTRQQGWAAQQWSHFLDDVFRRPSIGPVAAWLILGLVTLVAWLTLQYAPGAATGAPCGAAAPPAAAGAGTISVAAGYTTLIAVTAITLLAGLQPVLEKRFASDWSGQISDWFARQHWALRAPVIVMARVLGALFRIPASALSFADYLLARPLAFALEPASLMRRRGRIGVARAAPALCWRREAKKQPPCPYNTFRSIAWSRARAMLAAPIARPTSAPCPPPL